MGDQGKTAMSRNNPSAPMQWLYNQGYLVGRCLDYGSGKGKDAETFGLEAFDPYHGPTSKPLGKFNTIACNYVLNVVSEEEAREILGYLFRKLSHDAIGSHILVTVRADLPKEGRPGKGCYQRCVEFSHPQWEILKSTSGYTIYRWKGKSRG